VKEVSISVSISGNTYPIKVKPEDQQNVTQAAQLINDKIKALKEVYGISDKRDLLAMCALQLATQYIQLENKTNSSDAQLARQLTQMDILISSQLR